MSLVHRVSEAGCSPKIRCNTCGSIHTNFSVRYYAPFRPTRTRSSHSVSGRTSTGRYPRKHGAPACASCVVTGFCRAITEFGRCNFDHPLGVNEPKKKPELRCKVCTLKLPCRAHFPGFGELLAEEDRQLMTSIEDSDVPLPVNEIVAVIPARCTVEEAVYAYVLEDNLNFNTTQVVYSAKGYERTPSIERAKVFKLRGFLFHHDKK